jgi:hypothetical protein
LRVLTASVSYFALVFATGFALGLIRVPFLVPHLGVRIAELIEMPFMLVAIVLAAEYISRRYKLPQSASIRLSVGFLALALLLAAELSFALILRGESIGRYIAGRDPVSGSAYLAMLVLFALMPLILARVHAARLSSGNE